VEDVIDTSSSSSGRLLRERLMAASESVADMSVRVEIIEVCEETLTCSIATT
jgi:hypothetical protein